MRLGTLAGVRVVEMAGIGPCPMAGMLLADMGAEVIVVERPASQRTLGGGPAMNLGKRSVLVDLKADEGRQAVEKLILSADVLIEGHRPGVMERLGLGPAVFETRHPRLVYGRVTGWGQTGPLAQAAGHDINYVALSGLMSIASRPGQPPTVPASALADLSGGAMFLAFGVVCALLEARQSGQGQVVDAAMIDGLGVLTRLVQGMRHTGQWRDAPDQNIFLHRAPFYDSFECADGKYITLGAIEPRFYAQMLTLLDLPDLPAAEQYQHAHWPQWREAIAARIRQKTRQAWCEQLEGSDVCFAPVLDLDETVTHAHQHARGNHVDIEGRMHPASAPRFSRTPGPQPQQAPEPGADTRSVLQSLGLTEEAIARITLPDST